MGRPAAGFAGTLTAAVTMLALAGSASAAVSQVGSCTIAAGTQCPDANLAGADLTNADLRNSNLRGANLSSANLAGANLHGANLREANLYTAIAPRANLSSVVLTGARMHHTLAHNANFNGSQLDSAHLGYLDATHASMRSTNFAGSAMQGTVLKHADLHGANFHGSALLTANLTAADIRHANFAHATFAHTQMWHAAFNGTTNLWPSNFNGDHLAVHGLYERFNAHLDAYDDYGHCGPDSTFNPREWTGNRYLEVGGSCSAKAQPGGSHGFNSTGPRTIIIIWRAAHPNEFELSGTHGVEVRGSSSSNWGTIEVNHVKGLAVGHTGSRHPGEPGGPLANNVTWVCCALPGKNEYIFRAHGWLPRNPVDGLVYGPKPQ